MSNDKLFNGKQYGDFLRENIEELNRDNNKVKGVNLDADTVVGNVGYDISIAPLVPCLLEISRIESEIKATRADRNIYGLEQALKVEKEKLNIITLSLTSVDPDLAKYASDYVTEQNKKNYRADVEISRNHDRTAQNIVQTIATAVVMVAGLLFLNSFLPRTTYCLSPLIQQEAPTTKLSK